METEYRFNTIAELHQSEEAKRYDAEFEKCKECNNFRSSELYEAFWEYIAAMYECKEAMDYFDDKSNYADSKDLRQ